MKLVLLLIAEALLALDWRQTLTIARDPAVYSEINKILRPHPSVAAVCRYFILCMLGLALNAWYFQEAGIYMSSFIVVLESVVTVRNRMLFGTWF